MCAHHDPQTLRQQNNGSIGTVTPFCKFNLSSLDTELSSADRISIPVLGQLIPGGARPGTAFAVEFDPDSQWLAVAASITAKTLMNNGLVLYAALARPVDDAGRDLSSLGIDVPRSFKEGRLRIDDFYTATLTGGRLHSNSPLEPYEFGLRRSCNIADFSIMQSKTRKELDEGRSDPYGPKEFNPTQPGWLIISDSLSVLLRFNEERPFLEWLETREHRGVRLDKRINLEAFVRGLHSESFYKRVEAACDGVIDIRVLEQDGLPKNLLRLRTLKGQPHDNRWHEIEIKPNGEAVLVS